jgi:DNA-directed RNA polymerase subunit D
MDHISDIQVINGNIVSGVFHTEDVAEANMLRRSILSEIETYAIDIVTFHINGSSRHDEIIAVRLGQLVIDNNKFEPPEDGDLKIRIDVRGPIDFTTEHIPELPFKYVTPIAILKAGQRIMCDIIVKKGKGNIHVKWRPVSKVTMVKLDNGYKISFKEIGMLDGESIFARAYENLRNAALRPPITIFSKPLVPYNLV